MKPASRPAAEAVNTDDEDADDADDCKFSSTSGDRYSKSTYTHAQRQLVLSLGVSRVNHFQ